MNKCFIFLDKNSTKEKIMDIANKIFTLVITIMTLAAAIIPIMMLSSSSTTDVDTTTPSTSGMPNTPSTTFNLITEKSKEFLHKCKYIPTHLKFLF